MSNRRLDKYKRAQRNFYRCLKSGNRNKAFYWFGVYEKLGVKLFGKLSFDTFYKKYYCKISSLKTSSSSGGTAKSKNAYVYNRVKYKELGIIYGFPILIRIYKIYWKKEKKYVPPRFKIWS